MFSTQWHCWFTTAAQPRKRGDDKWATCAYGWQEVSTACSSESWRKHSPGQKIIREEDMESGRICSTAAQQEECKRWVTKRFCCLYFMSPNLWKNAALQTTSPPSVSGMENFSKWGLPQWVTDVKSNEAPLCSTESPAWHCTTRDKAAPCTGASLCAALHCAPAAASGLSHCNRTAIEAAITVPLLCLANKE